jgi:predicted acylesterase/phospholipase RssA
MSDADLPQCDIVMKGGVTRGVVYPAAVAAIAKRFRFRSIGGTSAGAIAAVVIAAAELARTVNDDMRGFNRLAAIPQDLRASMMRIGASMSARKTRSSLSATCS